MPDLRPDLVPPPPTTGRPALAQRGKQDSQRPDLHGTTLDLSHVDVWNLQPGQRLRLLVEHVGGSIGAEWVPVQGWVTGEDGHYTPALVLVRGPALPPSRESEGS